MLDLKGYGWMLLEGLELTLLVGLLSLCVAITLGLFGAWGKLSSSALARGISGIYTTVIRGVPELLLILIVYYGTPTLIQNIAESFGHDININLNPFIAGVATIGFIYGAFATEVFRGAILAVPKGQLEAAMSVGLNQVQVVRKVLLPQVWRYVLPGIGNVWMVLIKATALVSVIQLPELMRNSQVAAGSTHLPFTFFLASAMIYLAISIISMAIQSRLEAWSNRGYEGP